MVTSVPSSRVSATVVAEIRTERRRHLALAQIRIIHPYVMLQGLVLQFICIARSDHRGIDKFIDTVCGYQQFRVMQLISISSPGIMLETFILNTFGRSWLSKEAF